MDKVPLVSLPRLCSAVYLCQEHDEQGRRAYCVCAAQDGLDASIEHARRIHGLAKRHNLCLERVRRAEIR